MRHIRNFFSLSVFLLFSLFCAVAAAATVSGKISDSNGAGLESMEVRLWSQSPKGYEIALTETTDMGGTYTFANVPAGTYKLDARMAPGVVGNYGDTWYDVAAPTSNGLVGADADELQIAESDVLTGMNITLPTMGGLDGRIVAGGSPIQDLAVRVESKMDHRIHHNDVTDGPCCGSNPHLGKFYMRGLAPSTMASTYRLIIYDPTGVYQTTVEPGPFTVVADSDADVGDVTIAMMPADPNEPNDSGTDAATPTISALPYAPSGSSIAPIGDVDWYCINADAGDRYVATVRSRINVEGTERVHPWFDPMIGLWDGTQIVMTNDDAVPGQTWDSRLDTYQLQAAGRYCFVVTTFGDSAFDGTGQLSTGEYQLEVDHGNRPPTLEVLYEGSPAPIAPDEIVVDEGVPMQFVMNFSDPDGDVLGVEVRHFDNAGMPVRTGTFDAMATSATYDWTPDQQAGSNSPFELIFRVRDAEYDLRLPVVVRVSPVSLPPTVPVPISPEDGATVESDTVALVVENSTDPDGDSLTYDFQVEFGEPDAMPEAEATEPEDPSGTTSTTIVDLPENSSVHWRARAFDGAEYSAWSQWMQFLVDAQNDPPDAPVIVKPDHNARLTERQPTIAATVPEDPEGEDVSITIEVARDLEFGDVVSNSEPIEPTTDETMISWRVGELLELGGVYHVRASATDARGARSEYSDVVSFSIAFEDELAAPSFSGEFASCEEIALDALPAEVRVLNVDNRGDTVTFEVQITSREAPDDALVEATESQSDAAETVLPIEADDLPDGVYILRVRAMRSGETTDWTECPFSIGDAAGGDDGGSDSRSGSEGCGCATGGVDGSALALLGIFVFARRTRRTRRRRREEGPTRLRNRRPEHCE